MSPFDQEHLEIEPFDREYGLHELLPEDLLSRLRPTWRVLFPDQWTICNENGVIHYSQGPWQTADLNSISAAVAQSRPNRASTISGLHDTRLYILPMEYELETKGYLVIDGTGRDKRVLDGLGTACVCLLQQLMRLQHKTMLTSSLHGTVVEESYTQLKKKAAELARSEEKYRNLAGNLEIEVDKKTEEIRLAHARLMNQEKMAAIGQLSAGMAHEINNPLGFIISNLDTLSSYAIDLTNLIEHYRRLARCCSGHQDPAESGTMTDHCQAVERLETEVDGDFLLADIPTLAKESMSGAKRIQKIVGDLKIVARPGEKDPEPINVHTSIDAVLTILQNRMGNHIDIQRLYGPVALVPGYPQEINQVWLNLILNALEAMDGQGILGIETRMLQDHVTVTVSDSGKGIAPTELSNIFEPFFTTKKIGQGTGLGLHLAYQVISKHDGRIDVDSSPGTGSRFMVSLPTAGRE